MNTDEVRILDNTLDKRQQKRGMRIRCIEEEIEKQWQENGDIDERRFRAQIEYKYGIRGQTLEEYLGVLVSLGKISRRRGKIIYTGDKDPQRKLDGLDKLESDILQRIWPVLNGEYTFRPLELLNELDEETQDRLGHSKQSRLSRLGLILKKIGLDDYKERRPDGIEYRIDDERTRKRLRRLNERESLM